MAKRHAAEPGVDEPAYVTIGRDDPLLQAVIEKLPLHGPWYQADRESWLKLLGMALDVAYGSSAIPTPPPPPSPA